MKSVYMQCMRVLFILVLALPTAAAAQPPGTVMLWQPGDPGERLFLHGRVVGGDGQPLAGAVMYLRQTDGDGVYREAYRARIETAADGTFNIATVLPGHYRGPRHIHVAVEHPGHPALDMRIVFRGDPYLDQARPGDMPILLEESQQDGEKVLVGDIELVLGADPAH